MIENCLPDLQREVQRKLGRNLLRLQQYERGLKTLITVSDIGGAADEMNTWLARRRRKNANKSLGKLVGDFTGSFLATEHEPAEHQESKDAIKAVERGQVYFRMQVKIDISAEQYERIDQDLKQLVTMRNELVHHFLERFDLQNVVSCQKADAYLDECHHQIDAQWQSLLGWADAHDAARLQMVELMQTPAFRDFLIHGIELDGKIDWPRATIVNALRQAEVSLAKNGWTALADAIAYIRQSHPDHTPKRYGCSSWRQLIHESKLFEIRRENEMEAGASVVWYRSRTLAQELGQKP